VEQLVRVLVGVAHHGHKNRAFLERMLAEFRQMDHDVDVVIFSESAKDLGRDVEVRVGLPTPDPWSLPFAHRPLFAERRDEYDVFVYAEDDTLVRQRTLDTFVELSELLPEGVVPGFMRFEERPDGSRSYCSIHSYYRWLPGSTFRSGGLTFAAFTNEHAACYALTRAQLHRAISSGGFLVAPHQGAYDMLVSAATDPYTRCGMEKVVCVERLDDLLLHHLPNVYLDRLGISEAELRAQIEALTAVGRGEKSSKQLVRPEVDTTPPVWSKHTFVADEPIGDLLPEAEMRRVLSLGSVAGGVERDLVQRGIEVVAVPVDAVLGAVPALIGVEVLAPDAVETGRAAELGPYDAIVAVDVLPYVRDPVCFLAGLVRCLRGSGRLIATAPDHRRYRIRNRLRPSTALPLPTSWVDDGSHAVGPALLRNWLTEAGFLDVRSHHRRAERGRPLGIADAAGRVVGNSIVAVGVAPASHSSLVDPGLSSGRTG
jgi:SAM-dependent methyltransferase